jgi:FkbM family methyltransferase
MRLASGASRTEDVIDFSSIADTSGVGKFLRQPLRLLPRGAIVPVLQGRIRGMRWIVGSANHGCWLGTYEREKQQEFTQYVRPGDVVYDIGAHVGFYTLLASRLVGPRGRVYAFEPNAENLVLLHRHLSLNSVSNVTVLGLAVSESAGQACFEALGSSGRLSKTGHIVVLTESLDGLLSRSAIVPPSCIKIDVEGAEALVLRGAVKLIGACEPTIFLATHGHAVHAECLALLKGLGYVVRGIAGKEPCATDGLVATTRTMEPTEGRQRIVSSLTSV